MTNRDWAARPYQAGSRSSSDYGNTTLCEPSHKSRLATMLAGLAVTLFWIAFGAAWAVFACWSA